MAPRYTKAPPPRRGLELDRLLYRRQAGYSWGRSNTTDLFQPVTGAAIARPRAPSPTQLRHGRRLAAVRPDTTGRPATGCGASKPISSGRAKGAVRTIICAITIPVTVGGCTPGLTFIPPGRGLEPPSTFDQSLEWFGTARLRGGMAGDVPVRCSTPRAVLAYGGIKTSASLTGVTRAGRRPSRWPAPTPKRALAGRSAPASKACSARTGPPSSNISTWISAASAAAALRPAPVRSDLGSGGHEVHRPHPARRHQLQVRRPGGREVLISTRLLSEASKLPASSKAPASVHGVFFAILGSGCAGAATASIKFRLRVPDAAKSPPKAVCAGGRTAAICAAFNVAIRRYDGCSHQVRRRSKRAAQGRRRADSRQGPLYRRSRAAGLDACAGAALAACPREIHHQCHPRQEPAGRRCDPDGGRRQGSRRAALPVQPGSRSVHRPALCDPRPRRGAPCRRCHSLRGRRHRRSGPRRDRGHRGQLDAAAGGDRRSPMR